MELFSYSPNLARGIPEGNQTRLGELLNGGDGIPDQLVEKRLKALHSIFSASDSLMLHDSLGEENVGVLPQLLQGNGVKELIGHLLENPTRFRFPLAVLLSQVHQAYRGVSVHEKLEDEMVPSEFSIVPTHERIYLCPSAEPRFLYALQQGKTAVVGGGLVVKAVGVTAGLCVRPLTSPGGQTFMPGMWYVPSERDGMRHELESRISRGEQRVGHLEGKWTVMRPIYGVKDTSSKELFEQAQAVCKA